MLSSSSDSEFIEKAIRVNHAGEYGAVCIYHGQSLVFKNTKTGRKIAEMKEQEQKHFSYFDNIIKKEKIRPTFFLPLWHIMGVALGVTTAMMGKKSAMACTVAVEEVIGEHYGNQIENLPDGELKTKIAQFQQEELEHHDIALENDAENAFAYHALSCIIKKVCKTAIALSKIV